MPERKMIIVMSDSGRAEVEFVNDVHFTKREVLRILSTIKVESRQKVKEYRRNQRTKEQADNGRSEQGQSGQEQRREPDQRNSDNDKVEGKVGRAIEPNSRLAEAIAAKRQLRTVEGSGGGTDKS